MGLPLKHAHAPLQRTKFVKASRFDVADANNDGIIDRNELADTTGFSVPGEGEPALNPRFNHAACEPMLSSRQQLSFGN